MSLVNSLITKGYLKTDRIIDAFSDVSRAEFISDNLYNVADADVPFPIGYGQTISQPLTVAFMLELLSPKSGQNILDVGSGSGWTTALMAHTVAPKGHITALEIIPELCECGENNADKFGFVKDGIAQFHCINGREGYAKNAPYDAILVSAATDEIPEKLKKQLRIGGKMVIPIHNDIWYLEKKGEEEFYTEKFHGFSFVPLVTKGPA